MVKKHKEEKKGKEKKKRQPKKIEYGKSAFDSHVHYGLPKTDKRIRLSKTIKFIIICIAVILIILITYFGLNYLYGYELVQPGETVFNPI